MENNIERITNLLKRAIRNDEYEDLALVPLFLIFFRRIPKYTREISDVSMEFYEYLTKNADHIHTNIYNETKEDSLHGTFLFYYKDSLVSFSKGEKESENWGSVEFASDDPNFAKEIFKYRNKDKDKEKENIAYFGIVLPKSAGGLRIKKFPLKIPNLSIPLNYGEGFFEKNKAIIDSLSKNHHGLYLFHGPPGTGKTTYIKYLAHLLGSKNEDWDVDDLYVEFEIEKSIDQLKINKPKDKLFVYLPAQLMHNVSDPSFASLLLDQESDIVLILEDAEQSITSREDNLDHSAVATLLNLTDGIMGSILNVSIIVTFNTTEDKIDEALRRKGRLFAEHRFENLSIEDSQKLLNHLKINHKAEKPMSLAEIYNFELENFAEQGREKNQIGFGT